MVPAAAPMMTDLLILLPRLFCDVRPPEPLDGAYLYGETADNEDSVLHAAPRLLREGVARRILLLATPPLAGHPGFAAWEAKLRALGVPAAAIEPVPHDGPGINTLTEAEAVVRHARRAGHRAIAIVAAPFHQARAFITAVSVALREHPALGLYSLPGEPLPWDATVTHSQGVLTGTRASLVAGEIERLARYRAKGDLAAPEAVAAYLRRRDA
jgi:hypothetical protein